VKAVVQRVLRASVDIAGVAHAAIDRGYLVLLGIRTGDTYPDAEFLAEKCAALRVMDDGQGKMNLSLEDVGGSLLVVSQFTLYGEARKGNRPSFVAAATPAEAKPLYEGFLRRAAELLGPERVRSGVFGAMMQVSLVNDGPVTILIHSQHEAHS
jgi:D-tyrosyl-tRNA(Tyr) deacylase